MAIRLNTILVVLSVPTLLSAAVTILWRRKRNASKSATATTTTTTADTTDTPSTATIAETATTEKTEIQVSETVTRDIIPEPQSYPAARQPQSQQQVQCETVIPVMQITDGADLTQTPPTAVPDQPARTATTTAAAANGADATTDLSPKVEKDPVLKSKGKKQPPQQTEWKKSGSAKKEKMLSGSSDHKGKNLTNGQSPASDAHSPAAAVPGSEPDSRSRKTHDSGNSLDSGADVMSPASSAGAADPKSSDRSVDSPGLFKSDASQGSPCNWGTSDSHSEGSSDSGKGSENQSTSYSPLQQFMPNLNQRTTANVVFQFEIPADLVGKLIGKGGQTIRSISHQSRAHIVVNDYPYESCDHLKICTMDGDRMAIDEALKLIRLCFPQSYFPNLTLSQINAVPVATTQLFLMDAYPNDVIMSSLVSAGHFFLQQPSHPSHDSLAVLNHMMAMTYGENDAPAISSPSVGIIVAATVPALPGWYRALIVGISEDETLCDVKYVDYGGCSRLETSSLRQIRMDFMNLPFQACECFLADVLPVDGDTWSAAATECFEKLAQGCVLKAIVAGMTEDGCTVVRIYKQQGMATLCINEELVNRGLARWIQPPPAPTSASE